VKAKTSENSVIEAREAQAMRRIGDAAQRGARRSQPTSNLQRLDFRITRL